MIIDFHAHIFPDELAERAMFTLTDSIDNIYPPIHDGTARGLLLSMDDCGVDVSVVQPVITKQTHTKKTNEWAREVNSDRLISFGGIFPHTDNYMRDIDFVANLGLKGLKFHAEYQDFIIDEPRMLKIYDYALSKGLIILHHAGFDPAFNPPYKSTPKQFRNIARAMGGGIIIAAHFGGHAQWDEVEEYLAGENIWLDTSMGFEYYSRQQFLRVVNKHGADKILFASDSPWSDTKTEIAHLRAMPLPENEINAILGGNAARILGI